MCRRDTFRACVLYKSGTHEADCSRKVAIRKRVASVIRPLINARSLQLECVRVLHESLLLPVLRYVMSQ